MRAHVREVEAPAETQGLEELIAEAPPGEERSAAPPTGEPTAAPTVDGRALTARDLGPNGDVVLDILARAARLTADEARDLERDATWRWGFLAIAAAVIAPAGASCRSAAPLARPGPRRRPQRGHRGARFGRRRDRPGAIGRTLAGDPVRLHRQRRAGRPRPRSHRSGDVRRALRALAGDHAPLRPSPGQWRGRHERTSGASSDHVVVCLPDIPERRLMGELPANVEVVLVPPEPGAVPDLAGVDLIVPTGRAASGRCSRRSAPRAGCGSSRR